MPKSTPSPTNSAANATEIRLSCPTITSPSAAVMTRPHKVVVSTAMMSFGERKARNRISVIAAIVTVLLSPAFSATVANSSSASGACPVRRNRTPCSGVRFSRWASARMKSVVAPAGVSALKSSTGCTSRKRRVSRVDAFPSDNRLCQDNRVDDSRAGCPASTASMVVAILSKGFATSAAGTCPSWTAPSPSRMVSVMPCKVGSAASGPSRPCWRINVSVTRSSSACGINSRP